ncbi:MBL fold metallo-hydrolase [Paenibacillus silvae]|uniref:MBL fold metallo-hydrolase n=1 Tax=Paenibacillus silvae TaxID=1325358 RepID=UPI0011A8A5F1|nr:MULTISPECIES: MBL fold metallo-hydrolase [Paenibacillus]MCK6074621.1 MBL fold metallo-hydrolase [Paenibacillus silvae]MCK6147904.1 MBL fold metallo-hydrolase [Paenibacillus silvae]MCK6266202.1 MBL fold metallo-hydrolase [Paenibacillus silvae]
MLKQLSESIYYMVNDNERERPVLGLVCGEKYSLVIDAGNSVQHAREFLAEIQRLQVPPVRYVVLTHAHWDHFLGMNEYGDAIVIVNRLTEQRLNEWREYAFDDTALLEHVENKRISAHAMEVIQNEMPDRESLRVGMSGVVFEGTLQLDLGNKVCMLEQIRSTHTNDSTIVYVPEEKTLFLGDSPYSTTTSSLFHYKQQLLLHMIEDIQRYDAVHFLLGHESVCDGEEMDVFFGQLKACNQAVSSTSLDEAMKSFEREQGRAPVGDELFFLKALVNDRILTAD